MNEYSNITWKLYVCVVTSLWVPGLAGFFFVVLNKIGIIKLIRKCSLFSRSLKEFVQLEPIVWKLKQIVLCFLSVSLPTVLLFLLFSPSLNSFLHFVLLCFFPSTFMSLCWFVHMNIMYLIIMGLSSLFSLLLLFTTVLFRYFHILSEFSKNWYPGFKNCFLLHLQKCLLDQ